MARNMLLTGSKMEKKDVLIARIVQKDLNPGKFRYKEK